MDSDQHICRHCNKTFRVPYWRAGAPMFCSALCRNKARSRPIEDRFWEKVHKTDNCWLWTGAIMRGGYGVIADPERRESTHRLSYEIHNGHIPPDMLVCQTCHIPTCVNPGHLVLKTVDQAHKDRRVSVEDRFWPKVNKTETCWLWTGANSGGKWPYGVLGGGSRGEKPLKAHHISWELHKGSVPKGLWVLHKCDVTLCVRPDHLFLGKPADNSADMVQKNRCKTERLTAEQVNDIRKIYATGTVTQKSLAKQFNVCGATISNVTSKRTWRHQRQPIR